MQYINGIKHASGRYLRANDNQITQQEQPNPQVAQDNDLMKPGKFKTTDEILEEYENRMK